jgi:crotonobetainyl-CoA:carnitine CoA-transferase CaiB-like acyl-CoA transferase
MTKALKGVRILDFTHVQSGPTCTQLLAWFGADVIKVERPGVGDITRGQLQDIPNVDSLYFTMLNHNKRSITLDTKNPKGKEVLTALIKTCDVLVENFGPGVLDRMGFPWEKIHSLNPKMIVASIKGFGPDLTKTARCMRTSPSAPAARPRPPASATGCRSSPARRSATAAPGCISRSASSPRSTSAP